MSTAMLRAATITAAGLALGSAAGAEIVYGVTNTQTLVSFRSANPGALLTGVAVSGLQQNEQIRGIDFRPLTGELFALGSFNNLYTLNRNSGAATLVGAGSFSPGLNGASFGFDFNPTIDRIRVVSETNQNLVLNPNTGTSTNAGVVPVFYASGDANNGADPSIVGSAYTNSFAGATTSQLYGVDSGLDLLVTQANSAGTLMTVGSLGVDITDIVGFDISGVTGTAYLSVVNNTLSSSTFWTVDLSSGAANMIGSVGGGAVLTSIAVVPAPGGVALIGASALMLASRRRRN